MKADADSGAEASGEQEPGDDGAGKASEDDTREQSTAERVDEDDEPGKEEDAEAAKA